MKDDITDEELNISICEYLGWEGVPVQQRWLMSNNHKKKIKYWSSITPVEILNELGDVCVGMVSRWLKQPNGTPFILKKQHVGYINNNPIYKDKPVLEYFDTPSDSALFCKFQSSPWPVLEPSLKPFVKYLPNYVGDLNLMQNLCESVFVETDMWIDFINHLCNIITNTNCSMKDALIITNKSTSREKAKAFIRTIETERYLNKQ